MVQKNSLPDTVTVSTELWSMGIAELAGRNLESAGREEVNQMLEMAGCFCIFIRSNIVKTASGASGQWQFWVGKVNQLAKPLCG
jgi:hypothetical protein